jgi:hypothetical protein
MKNFFRILLGFIYFFMGMIYFFLVSVPLAFIVYVLLHVGVLIKLIYNQIKSVCKKITTR